MKQRKPWWAEEYGDVLEVLLYVALFGAIALVGKLLT